MTIAARPSRRRMRLAVSWRTWRWPMRSKSVTRTGSVPSSRRRTAASPSTSARRTHASRRSPRSRSVCARRRRKKLRACGSCRRRRRTRRPSSTPCGRSVLRRPRSGSSARRRRTPRIGRPPSTRTCGRRGRLRRQRRSRCWRSRRSSSMTTSSGSSRFSGATTSWSVRRSTKSASCATVTPRICGPRLSRSRRCGGRSGVSSSRRATGSRPSAARRNARLRPSGPASCRSWRPARCRRSTVLNSSRRRTLSPFAPASETTYPARPHTPPRRASLFRPVYFSSPLPWSVIHQHPPPPLRPPSSWGMGVGGLGRCGGLTDEDGSQRQKGPRTQPFTVLIFPPPPLSSPSASSEVACPFLTSPLCVLALQGRWGGGEEGRG
eukprot:Hpha_TRINITY_DN15180_c2_g13::TRINITY_DN15180_c2_g13_i1::g.127891::m.127891